MDANRDIQLCACELFSATVRQDRSSPINALLSSCNGSLGADNAAWHAITGAQGVVKATRYHTSIFERCTPSEPREVVLGIDCAENVICIVLAVLKLVIRNLPSTDCVVGSEEAHSELRPACSLAVTAAAAPNRPLSATFPRKSSAILS